MRFLVTAFILFAFQITDAQNMKFFVSKSAIENAISAGGYSGKLSLTEIFDPEFIMNDESSGNYIVFKRIGLAFDVASIELGGIDDSSFQLTLKDAKIYPHGYVHVEGINLDLAKFFTSDIVITGSVRLFTLNNKSYLHFFSKSVMVKDLAKIITEAEDFQRLSTFISSANQVLDFFQSVHLIDLINLFIDGGDNDIPTSLPEIPAVNILTTHEIVRSYVHEVSIDQFSEIIEISRKPKLQLLPNGISILVPYKIAPAVNESENLVSSIRDLGTIQIRRPNVSIWDNPVKSSFAIIDNLDSGVVFQSFHVEKTIFTNNQTYLFKNTNKVVKGLLPTTYPNSGVREITVTANNVDTRFSGIYNLAKHMYITNTMENISINTGKIKIDNNEFMGKLDEYIFYDELSVKNLHSIPVNASDVFLGWSDGVQDNPRAIIINKDYDGANALTAKWKGILTSNTSGWVQNGMENFNGTEAVLYPSMNELWLHIEEIS